MNIAIRKDVAEILDLFKTDPSAYEGTPVCDLIRERIDILSEQSGLVKTVANLQSTMSDLVREALRLEGAASYVEAKIISALASKKNEVNEKKD